MPRWQLWLGRAIIVVPVVVLTYVALWGVPDFIAHPSRAEHIARMIDWSPGSCARSNLRVSPQNPRRIRAAAPGVVAAAWIDCGGDGTSPAVDYTRFASRRDARPAAARGPTRACLRGTELLTDVLDENAKGFPKLAAGSAASWSSALAERLGEGP